MARLFKFECSFSLLIYFFYEFVHLVPVLVESIQTLFLKMSSLIMTSTTKASNLPVVVKSFVDTINNIYNIFQI